MKNHLGRYLATGAIVVITALMAVSFYAHASSTVTPTVSSTVSSVPGSAPVVVEVEAGYSGTVPTDASGNVPTDDSGNVPIQDS